MSKDAIHPDLLCTKELIYDKFGYACTNLLKETESTEYGACTFKLNNISVKFRVAKITPTKTGQFVALWKRDTNSITQPHDISDPIDLFIVTTRKDNLFGQFIFPKSVLVDQNILSTNGKGGKRGIRVYPPWDKTINKQAQKTQQWQLKFFLEIDNNLNRERLKLLYG